MQWTGHHQRTEQLFCLGIGIRRIREPIPREFCNVLPRSMPYCFVTKGGAMAKHPKPCNAIQPPDAVHRQGSAFRKGVYGRERRRRVRARIEWGATDKQCFDRTPEFDAWYDLRSHLNNIGGRRSPRERMAPMPRFRPPGKPTTYKARLVGYQRVMRSLRRRVKRRGAR